MKIKTNQVNIQSMKGLKKSQLPQNPINLSFFCKIKGSADIQVLSKHLKRAKVQSLELMNWQVSGLNEGQKRLLMNSLGDLRSLKNLILTSMDQKDIFTFLKPIVRQASLVTLKTIELCCLKIEEERYMLRLLKLISGVSLTYCPYKTTKLLKTIKFVKKVEIKGSHMYLSNQLELLSLDTLNMLNSKSINVTPTNAVEEASVLAVFERVREGNTYFSITETAGIKRRETILTQVLPHVGVISGNRRRNGTVMFVKDLHGVTHTVYVNFNNTINTVKKQIFGLTGIPEDDQRIILAGKELLDTKPLGRYGLQRESTMHLILKR